MSESGPAARLLKLFEGMSNVSYIYSTHSLNSGLVTYHRKKGESRVMVPNNQSLEDSVVDEIEAWRLGLKISRDEILVFFAFQHDEEYRCVRIFTIFFYCRLYYDIPICLKI